MDSPGRHQSAECSGLAPIIGIQSLTSEFLGRLEVGFAVPSLDRIAAANDAAIEVGAGGNL
jgi:hypothetical protein